MIFDKTIRFSDGVVLNVHINSDGDLESAFFPDYFAYEDGDSQDGSILEDYDESLLSGPFDRLLYSICLMSDEHDGYEKIPYVFL